MERHNMSFNAKLTNLFEASFNGYTEVSESEIRNKIEKEASEFKPNQKLFHFIPQDDLPSSNIKFLSYTPSKSEDKPLPYHELIIDNLKTWNDFPNRKSCIKGYSDKMFTTKTGIPFVIVPENGATVAICPKDRIVNSFPNVAINLGINFSAFDRALNIVLNIFNNPEGTYTETKKIELSDEKFYNESYKNFYDAMIKVDEMLPSSKSTIEEIVAHPHNKEAENNVLSILHYIQAKKLSLPKTFEKLFDPQENGFKSVPFNEYSVLEHKNREAWVNVKCWLVRETEFVKIVGD